MMLYIPNNWAVVIELYDLMVTARAQSACTLFGL